MKLVAKVDPELKDDPRSVDRVSWNRIRLLAEHRAIHDAWGSVLYRLHADGRIDNDEREAGDRYWWVIEDYRRAQATDPEESPEYQRELEYKRIAKAKKRYIEVKGMLGLGRNVLDRVVIENEWPCCEREQLIVKQCLSILKTFFLSGKRTKRKQNRA